MSILKMHENAPSDHDSTSPTTAQTALELMANIAHAARSKSGIVPFAQRNKQYWHALFQHCLMTVSDPVLYKNYLQKQRQHDQGEIKQVQKKISTKQRNLEKQQQSEQESSPPKPASLIHPPRQIAC